MQKNLVIVESPAKAKTIQRYLGSDYKVMPSFGHIRDLKKKNNGIDPKTFQPQYEIPKDKAHVVSELRKAGVPAELYLGRAGMKAQMKYADRRGAPAAVILGGDEIAAGQVTIKDLDAGRAAAAGIADNEAWKAERPGQVVLPRAELVSAIRRIIE